MGGLALIDYATAGFYAEQGSGSAGHLSAYISRCSGAHRATLAEWLTYSRHPEVPIKLLQMSARGVPGIYMAWQLTNSV